MRRGTAFIEVVEGIEATAFCSGPAADGSCPRVGLGSVLPCAGHVINRAGAAACEAYAVPRTASLCPVTLARALAVDTMSSLAYPVEPAP